MKNLLLIVIFFVALSFDSTAQFYSGKYESSPKMEDFDHIVIHQHPHHHKYGGDLSVKAFVEHGELWHSKAVLVSEEKASEFKSKFAVDLNILSVYELDIELDGEEWEYFLLGYEDDNKKSSFVVVEEIFDFEDLTKPVEVNTFVWNKKHHHKNL